MEKGVLGKTRKFKNGSVHETASGKLMIVDRYLSEDGKVWLRYQWLSGENEGKTEENKEENINASLYKFKISRGFKELIEIESSDTITPKDNFDKLNDMDEKIDWIVNVYKEKTERINSLETLIKDQYVILEKVLEKLSVELDNRMILQKLIEKM